MSEKPERYLLSTAAGRGEGIIEIGGLEFDSRALTLEEADGLETRGSDRKVLESLLPAMKRRLLTAGREEDLTVDFMRQNLTREFLTALVRLLVNGKAEADPKR